MSFIDDGKTTVAKHWYYVMEHAICSRRTIPMDSQDYISIKIKDKKP